MRGSEQGFRAKSLWTGALALTAAAALVVASQYLDLQGALAGVLQWISDLGAWGALVFILTYILATVLFVPGLILTMGAGFLFGVIQGAVLVSIASTTGAGVAFLIGRYLARDWVAQKVQGHPKFNRIDEAIGREGWRIVGLVRLSPVFPFNFLNYAFGLTQVRFRDYLLASWIGMLPATVLYVYIGSLAGSLASVSNGAGSRTPAEWALYALGLLATLIVTIFVTRIARRALQEKVG